MKRIVTTAAALLILLGSTIPAGAWGYGPGQVYRPYMQPPQFPMTAQTFGNMTYFNRPGQLPMTAQTFGNTTYFNVPGQLPSTAQRFGNTTYFNGPLFNNR
jgi:hypothetical protein